MPKSQRTIPSIEEEKAAPVVTSYKLLLPRRSPEKLISSVSFSSKDVPGGRLWWNCLKWTANIDMPQCPQVYHSFRPADVETWLDGEYPSVRENMKDQ